jgi:chromodomain-helicase-DNA-binding protein 4
MSTSRKRKRLPDDDSSSERDASLSAGLDTDDDDIVYGRHSRRFPRATTSLSLRSQGSHDPSARQRSSTRGIISDDEDELAMEEHAKPMTSRSLRPRPPPPAYTTDNGGNDMHNYAEASDDDGDPNFNIITSDIVTEKGRSRRKNPRFRSSRRIQSRHSTKRKSPDSDIEFEAPRRSGRSTQNRGSMRDYVMMDEDSIPYADDKLPAIPKVSVAKEIFQPIPIDSSFASFHMDTCHTCSDSRQRGQLIYCQGCSLAYHKTCLGYRHGREHLVTKVEEENFVLQCKFCINIYRSKNATAPYHSKCQGCRVSGESCTPFSVRRTARQEEKLREDNDGVDPISPVSPSLLNNSDHVLFRCIKCHRGWHIEHLPPAGADVAEAATDVRLERLKDYSIDWRCNDCSSAKHKIHRLVAWRPVQNAKNPHGSPATSISSMEVNEDLKEYLVKWESTSYAHCTWRPGAWVFGMVAPTMRITFGKRDAEQSLLKHSEKDAVPDEYLIPDIIFKIKLASPALNATSKDEALANISKVQKILVKYQGLGYDDVVWDKPPSRGGDKNLYDAYLAAYYDYVEGKHFQSEPYSKIRDRIKYFRDAEFEELQAQPAGLMRGKLMGYQIEGLNWLLENYHQGKSVVLADEMGLGKTVQVVSLVVSLVQDRPKVSRHKHPLKS